MLTALGYGFHDADGRQLYGSGEALAQIHTIHRTSAPRTGRHRARRRQRRPQPAARRPTARRRSSDPKRAPDRRTIAALEHGLAHLVAAMADAGICGRRGTGAARGRRKRRRDRLRLPAAGRQAGLRRRLLPGPAGLQRPQGQLRRRHHRRRQHRRTDPRRQTARRRRPAVRNPPDHRRRRPLPPPPGTVVRTGRSPGSTPWPSTPTRTPPKTPDCPPPCCGRIGKDIGASLL